MIDAESKFYQFLESHNIELREPIEYGRLVKYTDPSRLSRNKKDKPHWYIAFFNDGSIWAKIGSHSTDNDIDGYLIFKSYNDNELTPEQIEDFKHRSKEASIAYKKEMEAYRLECKKKAQENWAKCTDADPKHPYLTKKNLPPTGVKQLEDMIIVPAYSADELVSYLRIFPDSTRKNMKGAIKGCYCPIGDIKASDTIYVSESWSTSCTAHHVTGKAAIATFGAGNLVTATVLFKDLYPNKRFVMIQDDNEAGKKAADEWRAIVKQEVIEPTKPYIDLNDLYVAEGADAVKEALKVPTLPIISMRDFLAKPKPPLEWNVDNFLLQNMIGAVYGLPGSGKSTFLLQLSYCLASGTPFFEREIQRPKRVLYVDAEMGEQLLDNTWKTILEANNSEETPELLDLLQLDYLESGRMNIDDDLWKVRLDQVFPRYDVIIFDNYLKLIPSVDYDQQHKLWTPVFEWLRPWAKKQNKCVLFGHHSAKSGSMRGASEMNNDLDFTLCLQRNPWDKDYMSIQVEFGDKRRGIHPKHSHPFQCDLLTNGWILNPVEPAPKPSEKRKIAEKNNDR